jgi:glycosyltransferase involved in cell wall biosynthesis
VSEIELLASVVVAVQGDGRIRRLVDSLLAQTVPCDTYEVIVIENGTAEFADVDGLGDGIVRYLHQPAANMAAARNIGLDAARGRYLLLTDADCVAQPDWIAEITAALADGSVSAVGGAIVKHEPQTWTQRYAVTVVDGQRSLSYLPALHLSYVAGANAGFVTEQLREAGGFDEELHSGNDVDVCYKLGLRGYQVGLAPSAVICHDDRSGLVAHFRRFRRYAVYQVLLHKKYKAVSGKRLVLDGYPLRRALAAVRAAPQAISCLMQGDRGPGLQITLQLVEAAGVFVGEVQGAVRYRQLYL